MCLCPCEMVRGKLVGASLSSPSSTSFHRIDFRSIGLEASTVPFPLSLLVGRASSFTSSPRISIPCDVGMSVSVSI